MLTVQLQVSGVCLRMSDSFLDLYSGDNAVMMSELLYWCYTVRQHSGIGWKSKAVLSIETSMALLLNAVNIPARCICLRHVHADTQIAI